MTFKTPLNEEHRKIHGVKMTEFCGWDMPLYYGSQIEEHNRVRQDAGMFDVSHMNVVDVKGKGARDFLRYLFANDIDKLKSVGAALYSCMLNERGGVVDDLIVYRYADKDYYRVVVNAATHDKDLAWINQHAKKFDVEVIERADLAMIAIQGPQAIAKVATVFAPEFVAATKDLKVFHAVAVGEWWIARTGYTGEDGYEIMMPLAEAAPFWRKLLAAGVAPCGLVSRDGLRLEAGLSLYGSEMDENVSPLESNLTWTVSFVDPARDFVGRKALEAQKAAGLKRNIFGLVLEDKGVLRSHQKVILPGIGEGETTSGGYGPTVGGAVALARLPIEAKLGDSCFVVVRDKQLKARIIKPPFARNGKKVF
jgi:aminomethyltransferase